MAKKKLTIKVAAELSPKGYTPCPECGIDSMDGELCAYCEEEEKRAYACDLAEKERKEERRQPL